MSGESVTETMASPAGGETPAVIRDRYFVLEDLGAGGSGVVYAVYDRVLDRRVALKLMRSLGSERLLREAQAMARLKHPNVVTVYDVGIANGRGFVTMELIDGVSLRAWLSEEARPVRAVLDLFLQAGRGLAAAHAAGLIHRDFKPDNVLVSHGRMAQVADFGLARLVGQTIPSEPDVPSPGGLSADVTRTGTVLGTPRYMAPEQRRGEPADARSDQFSFCVAVWEAVYGEHPFPDGQISGSPVAPARSAVPAGVRAALARGLQLDPTRRWPAMEPLLATLARDPARARRRGVAAAVVAGVVAASFGGVWLVRRGAVRACAGSEARVSGVWDGGRRRAVEAAFAATASPLADAAFRQSSARLDAYADELAAQMRDTCEATEVRGEQTPQVMSLRTRCLEQRRAELDATVGVLAKADATTVRNAIAVVGSLPRLATCADVRQLIDEEPLPTDPAQAAAIATLASRTAQAEALSAAGRPKDAAAVAEAVVADAEANGYAPARARALAALARARRDGSDFKGAEDAAYRSLLAALAGRSDARATAAATTLALLTGRVQSRWDEADRYLALARVLLARAGRDADLEGRLEQAAASNAFGKGDLAQSETHYLRARALLVKAHGEDGEPVARLDRELGAYYYERHRDADSAKVLERALATIRRIYGPDHPLAALTAASLAQTYLVIDRRADAVALLEGAVGSLDRTIGSDQVDTAQVRRVLGGAYLELKRYTEARAAAEAALPVLSARFGPTHRTVFATRVDLAQIRGEQGDVDGAIADLQTIIREREEAHGRDHFQLVGDYYWLRHFAEVARRWDLAVGAAERALEIARKAHGPDSPILADAAADVMKMKMWAILAKTKRR